MRGVERGENGFSEEPYHAHLERQLRHTDKDRGVAY